MAATGFYLGGDIDPFDEALAFVVLSFIAFQVVRPRYGMMRKVLEDQRALMESGQFMQG